MVETLDIHTHILPGIDDGAEDIQNALDMVKVQKAGNQTLWSLIICYFLESSITPS